MDIKNYLVSEKNIAAMDELKARKTLEQHNHFMNGWVAQLRIKELPDRDIVIIVKERSSSVRSSRAPVRA